MNDLIDHAKRTPGKYTQPIFLNKLHNIIGRPELSKLTGYSSSHIGKVLQGYPCCIALEKACKLEYIERTGSGTQGFLITCDKDVADKMFNILSSTNLHYEVKKVF